jgi:hypothetical protein
VIEASDTSTIEIKGSLLPAVFIPGLHQLLPISQHKPANLIQLSGREAVIAGKHNGFQPKLAEHIFTLDVRMLRFETIEAVKENRYGPGIPLTDGIVANPLFGLSLHRRLIELLFHGQRRRCNT